MWERFADDDGAPRGVFSSAFSRVTLVLFRRRALGEMSGAEHEDGARVRKSRQKEAAGAADAARALRNAMILREGTCCGGSSRQGTLLLH